MKIGLCWTLIILSLLGIAGCGLKGPLTLPPQNQEASDEKNKEDINQSVILEKADETEF